MLQEQDLFYVQCKIKPTHTIVKYVMTTIAMTIGENIHEVGSIN